MQLRLVVRDNSIMLRSTSNSENAIEFVITGDPKKPTQININLTNLRVAPLTLRTLMNEIETLYPIINKYRILLLSFHPPTTRDDVLTFQQNIGAHFLEELQALGWACNGKITDYTYKPLQQLTITKNINSKSKVGSELRTICSGGHPIFGEASVHPADGLYQQTVEIGDDSLTLGIPQDRLGMF